MTSLRSDKTTVSKVNLLGFQLDDTMTSVTLAMYWFILAKKNNKKNMSSASPIPSHPHPSKKPAGPPPASVLAGEGGAIRRQANWICAKAKYKPWHARPSIRDGFLSAGVRCKSGHVAHSLAPSYHIPNATHARNFFLHRGEGPPDTIWTSLSAASKWK